MYPIAVLRRGAPKSLLSRHVDNKVDISNNLKGIPGGKCGSRAARVALGGGQEKEAIVTVYVLYCFDARGVIVVRYCFKRGLFYV